MSRENTWVLYLLDTFISQTHVAPFMLNFSDNSLRVLKSRYLINNETPEELFGRVAIHIAISDILHDKEIFTKESNSTFYYKDEHFINPIKIGQYTLNEYHLEAFSELYNQLAREGHMKCTKSMLLQMVDDGDLTKYQQNIRSYYEVMTNQLFMPNTPTLMNAGASLGQLSACFVLDMPDDMAGIMDTCKDAAMIFKSGGGVGINYSNLREEGAKVKSTDGVASGPVSFMEIINSVTNVIKQGGKRRGANMGILDIKHPDIKKFIKSKVKGGVLENFNISVAMWDKPETYKELDLIAKSAHSSAEPGVIFFDNMNKHNPLLKARGKPLNSTNPCGEQGLYANESCNLGSINVSKLFKSGGFDWKMYEKTIRLCTRFLDNIIDINVYPTKAINIASKETRRIGLGVMGVADLLFKMDIKYDSPRGLDFMGKLAEKLTHYSIDESIEIAKDRGSYGLYDGEYVFPSGVYSSDQHGWAVLGNNIQRIGLRNVLTTTIAPTGTIAMIADCSNGMEPAFALSYRKKVSVGEFEYINPILEQRLKEEDTGDIPECFVTAMDIHWSDHIKAQAVWQKWIGNSISKTINMPSDVTVNDIKEAYGLAHKLGCKGITVYRDGSRDSQVLYVNKKDEVNA